MTGPVPFPIDERHAAPPGWRAEIERTLAESVERLAKAVDEETGRRLLAARREMSEALNQAARRLRQARGEAEWSAALGEAAAAFCGRAALFAVEDGNLRALRLPEAIQPDAEKFPLAAAAAFHGAAESGDPVVAVRSERELSTALAAVLGAPGSGRFYLFPVTAAGRVRAILYADSEGGGVEAASLELLTAVAGAALEWNQSRAQGTDGLVRIAAAPAKPAASWDALSPEERSLHLRAQRFAKVRVAAMLLYRPEDVRRGRGERDLYAALREDIDGARAAFQTEFFAASPTMVDYLHLEILRALAHEDGAALGEEYPGPKAAARAG